MNNFSKAGQSTMIDAMRTLRRPGVRGDSHDCSVQVGILGDGVAEMMAMWLRRPSMEVTRPQGTGRCISAYRTKSRLRHWTAVRSLARRHGPEEKP